MTCCNDVLFQAAEYRELFRRNSDLQLSPFTWPFIFTNFQELYNLRGFCPSFIFHQNCLLDKYIYRRNYVFRKSGWKMDWRCLICVPEWNNERKLLSRKISDVEKIALNISWSGNWWSLNNQDCFLNYFKVILSLRLTENNEKCDSEDFRSVITTQEQLYKWKSLVT